MRRLAVLAGMAFTLLAPTWASAEPAQPWAQLAHRDLEAIHDLLAANHPGPVDPRHPRYAAWLKDGLVEAGTLADQAKSFPDYRRAVLLYVNGFRDGHVTVFPVLAPMRFSWSGLLAAADEDGKPRVTLADAGLAPVGAEVIACDGRSVGQLLAERVDAFSWNRDIPHARLLNLNELFYLYPGDDERQLSACELRIEGKPVQVKLRWRPVDRTSMLARLAEGGAHTPALGMRKVAGVWLISIPSFNYFGEGAAGIEALIAEIRARAPELRAATVVFDVRGNAGGNSAWADQVAYAFWGEPAVKWVTDGFDWTVDWRVSPDNIKGLEGNVARSKANGLTEAVESWGHALEVMKAAQAQGRALARVEEGARSDRGPRPANLAKGRVYLLTDNACFSSCLMFADILRQMPGVTHIGLPTSADTAFVDNTDSFLPSGLFRLSYSMKVARNRGRGDNQWYEPQIRWPGGPMTDEAVAAWVASLP